MNLLYNTKKGEIEMDPIKKNLRFNFWMLLFMLLTVGMLTYLFWPKIRELILDLQFLRAFLKERKDERKSEMLEFEREIA